MRGHPDFSTGCRPVDQRSESHALVKVVAWRCRQLGLVSRLGFSKHWRGKKRYLSCRTTRNRACVFSLRRVTI